MSSIQHNQGTDKARGLENAALQHLKHKSQQEASTTAVNPQAQAQQQPQSQPTTATSDPQLVAKVELNQPAAPVTNSYSPTTVLTNKSNDTTIIGNGAKVNINSTVGVDNGNDTTNIGNGAKVNIESQVGVDNSDDNLIIGNGTKVDIKSSVGVDNGNDTIIIGNGAKVTINSTVGVDNSNDTLIIENGAKVEINGSSASTSNAGRVIIGSGEDVKVDGTVGLGNDGFTYKDGKLSVQLKDDKNNLFRWELNVKNQQDAETLIETMKNKLKEKTVTFEDLRSSVQEQQNLMKQRDELIKNYKDGKHDNPFGNQGFNRYQNQLDMQFNLVKSLMTQPGKQEESLHSKMMNLTKQLHDLNHKEK